MAAPEMVLVVRVFGDERGHIGYLPKQFSGMSHNTGSLAVIDLAERTADRTGKTASGA
jgi:hypothetical protein